MDITGAIDFEMVCPNCDSDYIVIDHIDAYRTENGSSFEITGGFTCLDCGAEYFFEWSTNKTVVERTY